MGKLITLGGALPPDNNDGLTPHGKDILDEARRRLDAGDGPQIFNVVARVAAQKVVWNTETGEPHVVLRVHHWEMVPPQHQGLFGDIIGAAFGARTGALELPFPDDEVPLRDPFPEEAAEDARAAIEAADEPGPGDDSGDELAAPRRARRGKGN